MKRSRDEVVVGTPDFAPLPKKIKCPETSQLGNWLILILPTTIGRSALPKDAYKITYLLLSFLTPKDFTFLRLVSKSSEEIISSNLSLFSLKEFQLAVELCRLMEQRNAFEDSYEEYQWKKKLYKNYGVAIVGFWEDVLKYEPKGYVVPLPAKNVLNLIAEKGSATLVKSLQPVWEMIEENEAHGYLPSFLASLKGHYDVFKCFQEDDCCPPIQMLKLEDIGIEMKSSALHNFLLFFPQLAHRYVTTETTFSHIPPIFLDIIFEDNFINSFDEYQRCNKDVSVDDYTSSVDFLGWTISHWAAALGNLDWLTDLDNEDVNVYEIFEGVTPMHLACIAGHGDVVEFFTKSLCRNITGKFDLTSFLRCAIFNGKIDCVQHLVNMPSRFQVKNECDLDILVDKAKEKCSAEVAEMLKNRFPTQQDKSWNLLAPGL